METAEMDALFAQALMGDYDGDEPWAAIDALRKDSSREILERAAAWSVSDEPLKRARAADVLCKRADPRGESYPIVSRML